MIHGFTEMPNQKRHIAFIYTEESIGNLEPVTEHSPDVIIQSSLLDDFLQNPDILARNVDHIVVSAPSCVRTDGRAQICHQGCH
jgi:hypothetical protein